MGVPNLGSNYLLNPSGTLNNANAGKIKAGEQLTLDCSDWNLLLASLKVGYFNSPEFVNDLHSEFTARFQYECHYQESNPPFFKSSPIDSLSI